MKYTVETYTTQHGSNMDCIEYQRGIGIDEVAWDLLKTVDGWDYAYVTDTDDNDRTIELVRRDLEQNNKTGWYEWGYSDGGETFAVWRDSQYDIVAQYADMMFGATEYHQPYTEYKGDGEYPEGMSTDYIER